LLEDVKVKYNFKSPNRPTDFLFCPHCFRLPIPDIPRLAGEVDAQ